MRGNGVLRAHDRNWPLGAYAAALEDGITDTQLVEAGEDAQTIYTYRAVRQTLTHGDLMVARRHGLSLHAIGRLTDHDVPLAEGIGAYDVLGPRFGGYLWGILFGCGHAASLALAAAGLTTTTREVWCRAADALELLATSDPVATEILAGMAPQWPDDAAALAEIAMSLAEEAHRTTDPALER